MSQPPDEADDEIDPEGPDPSEMDYSDEPDLEVCPNCRKMISEEADRCPYCGEYLTPSAAPMSKTAWFVVAVIVLTLLSMIVYMLPI